MMRTGPTGAHAEKVTRFLFHPVVSAGGQPHGSCREPGASHSGAAGGVGAGGGRQHKS